ETARGDVAGGERTLLEYDVVVVLGARNHEHLSHGASVRGVEREAVTHEEVAGCELGALQYLTVEVPLGARVEDRTAGEHEGERHDSGGSEQLGGQGDSGHISLLRRGRSRHRTAEAVRRRCVCGAGAAATRHY